MYRTSKRSPETLNGATVLVCGGAGFIGSNFIRRILGSYPGVRVVNFDKLTYSGNLDNLKDIAKNKRYTFVRGDIADGKKVRAVFARHRPEYVINFAAETHVDRSIHTGAEVFVRTNVLGTVVLLQTARHTPSVRKFLQISTDEVYGSLPLSSKKKFTEKSPLAPNSPYAASKAAADLVVHSYFVTHQLPVVISRCSNNYGPYQHPEKLIPFSISRLLEDEPITVYGDGKYVRDWIHVDDHCDALIRILLAGRDGDVYNVGASDEVDNRSLARRLVGYFSKDEKSAISFVADRPGHDRRYAINSAKVRRDLGWKPTHSLRDSLDTTVAWYVERQRWMRRALRRAGTPNPHIIYPRKDTLL